MEGVTAFEREGFRWGADLCSHTAFAQESFGDLLLHDELGPGRQGHVRIRLSWTGRSTSIWKSAVRSSATSWGYLPSGGRTRKRHPNVEPFRSLARGIMSGGRDVLFCADSGNCADTHFNLGAEGRWSHCGRSADWGLLDYGSIHDRSIAEVFADPQRDELRCRNEVLSQGSCRGCGCWAICHGGCPLDGYLNTGSLYGEVHVVPWQEGLC